jgi:hypothetical protein
LSITQAEYGRDEDGYAYLAVEINGTWARFDTTRKLTLYRRGIISLGSEFIGDPAFSYSIKFPDGAPTLLDGFTNDRRILSMFGHFLQALNDGTFEPGPQAIP